MLANSVFGERTWHVNWIASWSWTSRSTCWEGEPPPSQIRQIVEIGLCLVDVATLERVERRSILVRQACSTVSAYCTQLTTLTQADVEDGIPVGRGLPDARQRCRFRERLWSSFGDYDRQQFEQSCGTFGIAYPFGLAHLNVKTLAAAAFGWFGARAGMGEALQRVGLPLEGIHHHGGDDAWNIAGLLCHLLRRIRGT